MTQLTVSVVYVFPTILVQINRHLSQRASKTGRKQVMSVLTPMRRRTPIFRGKDGNDISARLQRQEAGQQHRTMKGVLSIIDVVIALGQRGIPLRCNWDPSKRNEDGNFLFFVDWKSKYDLELKDHLDHASGNAKYTSPKIQNKIINLCDSFI